MTVSGPGTTASFDADRGRDHARSAAFAETRGEAGNAGSASSGGGSGSGRRERGADGARGSEDTVGIPTNRQPIVAGRRVRIVL